MIHNRLPFAYASAHSTTRAHATVQHGSPLKKTNMAPTGWLFRSQHRQVDNLAALDNTAGNTLSKDTQFGQLMNPIHSPLGYSDPPLQLPFPGDPQFYHHAHFNVTPSSQPSTTATQGYPSYGPSLQASDFTQGGYGGRQMFPPQEFRGHGRSAPGTPRVPPAPPRNNPVIWPTSSSSSAPGQLPGAPGRPPISLPTEQFQPSAEPCRTDVAQNATFPPLPEISCDENDADYESNDPSDLGGAEANAPISLEQTEFSLKQFAKWMGQPNFSALNKWKNVWVAGLLEKKHRSIIRGQNRLKQLQDGPLHW